ncbi:MAG: spermidine/putrescine ABC transporter substrate-binding protein [Clostridia bacterium]|nr:spermidine/putrescine ABC transporter substrate-binding protein [Clostridia bacterium]
MIKRLFGLFTCFVLILTLSACKYEPFEITLRGDYNRPELVGTTLNVYNWGEYISDGGEDSMNVIKEFELLTGIKVNYSTYDSNESMYSLIKYGGVSYDIIIPSDYMIERMIKEGLLSKIDTSKLSNYDLIDSQYKDLYFDPNNEYSVPYSVGMVGLIYNTTIVEEEPDSWSLMWDEKYKGDILTFNNPRDTFAIAQFLLGYDINTTDKSEWDNAAELLKNQKNVLQAYVMDEVYNKMESGSAAIAPYYAGDYLSMLDNNEDLAFVYPKEGVNIFVDSACIPHNAENYEAAMLFINFLMEPDIALANAEYIYYASPNTSVTTNPDYSLLGDEIIYPSEENMPKTQYFHDMSPEIRAYFDKLWQDVKLH